MIHRIVGLQNQGKGVYSSYLVWLDFLHGYTIYSNTPLAFPHIYINKDFFLSLAKDSGNLNINNAVFLLDEFWIWCDSRNPTHKGNKLASYVLLQSSKVNWRIYTTCQTDNQDDLRLRNNAHYKSECERVVRNLDGTYSKILSEDRFLPPEINQKLYIEIKREKRTGSGIITLPLLHIKAEPLFMLYNTEQKIYMQQ